MASPRPSKASNTPQLPLRSMDRRANLCAKVDVPCAACRMLHRKCSHDCMLAPYFPADEPEKFAGVHKVFGASNVIKMLQAVDEAKREDAVKSMVYEARTRLIDPVYGCTHAIFYLQNCIKDLEVQLRTTREQVHVTQEERNQLLSILMDVTSFNPMSPINDAGCFLDNSMNYDGEFGIHMDHYQMI